MSTSILTTTTEHIYDLVRFKFRKQLIKLNIFILILMDINKDIHDSKSHYLHLILYYLILIGNHIIQNKIMII